MKIKCSGCKRYLLNGKKINYTIEFEMDIDKEGKVVERGKYIVCKYCGRKIDVNKIKEEIWKVLWDNFVEKVL